MSNVDDALIRAEKFKDSKSRFDAYPLTHLENDYLFLAAEVRRLRDMLDGPTDAQDLVVALSGVSPDHYIGGSTKQKKAIEDMEENLELVAAYRARLLDEAAERAVQWLAEQTGNIDPAIAATNSGKWLIKLREKQAKQLRAAVRGEVRDDE